MAKQDDILNLLISEKLLSQEQLEQLKNLSANGKNSIEDIILSKKMVDQEEYARVKAAVLDLPYANFLEKKMGEEPLSVIPIEVAENYKIICFEKNDKQIKIGIVDPDNFKAVEAVEFLAKEEKLQAEYSLISEQSFKAAHKQYKTFGKEISTALEKRAEDEAEDLKKIGKKEDGAVDVDIVKSAPISKIVSVIIHHAVEGGASDIHIEPQQNETRVRYRIDGILQTSLILPKNIHSSIVARIKVIANLKLDETRMPQDGRIRLVIDNKEIDFRVSILPLMGDEKVVMRILEIGKEAPTPEDLGFEGVGLEVIKKNLNKKEGLFLVTGPTGSGKSTTLYAVVNILNKEGINISTLEDPVEYQIKGANQSQIKPEIGYTFAAGLRSLLRQDPNVIMVGEIRDNETAELAIHSALTGHYVFSTLHTIDAASSISRLVDMDIEPFLLGSTLHTIVAQRLARKICSKCKTQLKIPDDYSSSIKKIISEIPADYFKKILSGIDLDNMVFYKGKGCPACGNSGYSGRVAISEVLDVNDKLKNLIMDGKKVLKADDIKNSQLFINFQQDGAIKVLQGITSIEEFLRVIAV